MNSKQEKSRFKIMDLIVPLLKATLVGRYRILFFNYINLLIGDEALVILKYDVLYIADLFKNKLACGFFISVNE